MICKLCQNKNKLVKSHIIPEAFFTSINNTTTPSKLISSKAGYRPKRSPIGVYDRQIACSDCESSFHTFDDYAITLFRDKLLLEEKLYLNGKHEGFNLDVDYNKLKLFFISLLWRASVSEHEFYNRIKLRNEEYLRQIFLNRDASNPNEFSVIGFKFNCDPGLVAMIGPFESVSSETPVANFVFNGLMFLISLKDGGFSEGINDIVLSPKRKWPIIFTNYRNSKYWKSAKTLAELQEYKVF